MTPHKRDTRSPMDRVVAIVRHVHPQPFRHSWGYRERKRWGHALAAAVRAGFIRRVRGAPGADWYALVSDSPV